jgi:EF hand
MLDRRLWAVAAGLFGVLAYLTIAEAQGPGGRGGRPEGGPMAFPLLQALDADGDGELSAKEIENATAALKTLDKDKNGKLSREEMFPAPGRFGGRGQGQGPGNDPTAMVSALMTYDKNADGKLSKDELPERLRPIMDRADANKDGFLDKTEVTEYAQRQGRRGPGMGPGGPDGGGAPRKGAGRRNDQGGARPGSDI